MDQFQLLHSPIALLCFPITPVLGKSYGPISITAFPIALLCFPITPVLGKSYGPISITAFPHCIAMFSHNSRVGLKLWTNLIYRGRLIHILYFVLFLFNLFILGSRDIFSVGRTRVKAASLPRYPTWRANNFPIFNCIT